MTLTTRSLKLTGASNFRDLGGYVGHEGRALQWRRIFRSDHLADLTPSDLDTLANLGIASSVDFRGVTERAALSYEWPGLTQHALAIEPTVVQRAKAMVEAGEALTAPLTIGLMEQTYRDFVLHNSDRFAHLFDLLLSSDQPLVFHCTAGKDRTGLAAALILEALGVSRDQIMQDYLLTNTLYQRPPGLAQTDTPADVLRVLWTVQEPFLEAAWRTIDQAHSGMPTYLEQTLGLTPERLTRLRSRYLES
jgi:protein-tyrosine phosphatase